MKIQERESGRLPGYMTVREAAKALGISAGALYNRLYRTDLPVIKAGRTLLLPDSTVMSLYAMTRHYATSR